MRRIAAPKRTVTLIEFGPEPIGELGANAIHGLYGEAARGGGDPAGLRGGLNGDVEVSFGGVLPRNVQVFTPLKGARSKGGLRGGFGPSLPDSNALGASSTQALLGELGI